MKNNNEEITNEILYDYVFHFNPHLGTWAAIPRSLYSEYWNDFTLEGVIRSSKYETLISILCKTKGDSTKIKELVK